MRHLRLAIISLLVVGAVALIYLAYSKIKSYELNNITAAHMISDDAFMVIQSDEILDDWNRISSSNLIWRDLKSNNIFPAFSSASEVVDSIITNNKKLEELVNNNTITISGHYDNKNILFQYIIELRAGESANNAASTIIKALPSNMQPESKTIEDGKIIPLGETSNLYLVVHKNLVLMSRSADLLTQSVTNSRVNSSLSEALRIAGSGYDVQGSIVVNTRVMNLLTRKKLGAALSWFNNEDTWVSLDFRVLPQQLCFNGQILGTSSTSLSTELRIHDWIPSNAGAFHKKSIRGEGYFEQLDADQKETVLEIDQRLGAHLESQLFGWLGDEIAEVQTQSGKPVIVLSVNPGSENVEGLILELSQRSHTVLGMGADSARYKSFVIAPVRLPAGLDQFFPIEPIHAEPLWMATNGLVVLASQSKPILKKYISSISKSALSEELNFSKMRSCQFSDIESSFFYTNGQGLINALEGVVKEKVHVSISNTLNKLGTIRFIGIQLVNSGKRPTLNLSLDYGETNQKSSSDHWDLQFASGLIGEPITIYNHRSKAKEILVQDEEHKLHLVSSTGQVSWSYQLDGRLLGVEQVDLFNNGRFQSLVTTANKLYMIDILGRDVRGFPYEFKTNATAPASVIDYESNHDYRFLVPTGNKIINIDKEGSKVNGWNFKPSTHPIKDKIHHFIIDNKDILLTHSVGGEILYLNRKGEKRAFSEPAVQKMGAGVDQLFVEKSNTLATSKLVYLDTNGLITLQYLGGTQDSLQIIKDNSSPRMYYWDVDGDESKDFLVFKSSQIQVIAKNKSVLFNLSEDDATLSYYTLDGKDIYLILQGDENAHIYSKYGDFIRTVPAKRGSRIVIEDINKDNVPDVIFQDSDNHLRALSIN